MNIDWIETYLDILETRNFNASAENLSLTQSTVSHRIQKLEEALGERLFVRGRMGAKVTIAGLKFEPHARAMRLEWRQAKTHLTQSGGDAARLHIGIQYDAAKVHAGAITQIVRQKYPHASMSVEVDYSQQMNRDLERGALDFAVVFTPSFKPDLYFEPLGAMDYIMVATIPTPLHRLDARQYTFPNISPAFAMLHQQELPQFSNTILTCGQSDAIAQFMLQLGGASYIQVDFAKPMIEAGEFHAVEDAPRLRQDVFLATHIKNRMRVSMKKLAQEFSALF